MGESLRPLLGPMIGPFLLLPPSFLAPSFLTPVAPSKSQTSSTHRKNMYLHCRSTRSPCHSLGRAGLLVKPVQLGLQDAGQLAGRVATHLDRSSAAPGVQTRGVLSLMFPFSSMHGDWSGRWTASVAKALAMGSAFSATRLPSLNDSITAARAVAESRNCNMSGSPTTGETTLLLFGVDCG